ncbi:MAG: helix-turn-helix transcriptional regulator [Chloroflexota bacterium]
MATKETRRQRGARRGRMLIDRVVGEMRVAREAGNVSLEKLAAEIGSSRSAVSRLERLQAKDVGVVQLSEIASALGYELSIGVHPVGDPVRDKAQLAIGRRLGVLIGPAWKVLNEVLLPDPGDRRSWDKELQLIGSQPPYAVGVDIESRIRDVQALVRRTRERERDLRVHTILMVLGDSATNRRLVGQLVGALGDAYKTSPRAITKSLREGKPLPGSGVLLV